jgi:lactoylglutathione lyase
LLGYCEGHNLELRYYKRDYEDRKGKYNMLINHVGVVVNDMNLSKEFYGTVLGGSVEHEFENETVHLVFMDFGNGIIELVKRKNEDFRGGLGVVEHIAFTVDNIEIAIEKLKTYKVQFISETPKAIDNKKVFFFQGPNGEKLEIVEHLK